MIEIGRLREMLDYDAETGVLTWKARPASHFNDRLQSAEQVAARWNSRFAGTAFGAGALDGKGYRFGRIDGQLQRAHRVAFALHNGRWPKGEIDHDNGNRTDNRATNLFDVTHGENGRNMKRSTRNVSGRVGVHWCQTRSAWIARIHSYGRTHFIGMFDCFEDAAEARSQAEQSHGFNPNHGRAAA